MKTKYTTQVGTAIPLDVWKARPWTWKRSIEVPLPRGVKNGDRVRVVLRGSVAERYVNGVRKADWRIPSTVRRV